MIVNSTADKYSVTFPVEMYKKDSLSMDGVSIVKNDHSDSYVSEHYTQTYRIRLSCSTAYLSTHSTHQSHSNDARLQINLWRSTDDDFAKLRRIMDAHIGKDARINIYENGAVTSAECAVDFLSRYPRRYMAIKETYRNYKNHDGTNYYGDRLFKFYEKTPGICRGGTWDWLGYAPEVNWHLRRAELTMKKTRLPPSRIFEEFSERFSDVYIIDTGKLSKNEYWIPSYRFHIDEVGYQEFKSELPVVSRNLELVFPSAMVNVHSEKNVQQCMKYSFERTKLLFGDKETIRCYHEQYPIWVGNHIHSGFVDKHFIYLIKKGFHPQDVEQILKEKFNATSFDEILNSPMSKQKSMSILMKIDSGRMKNYR